MKNVILSIIVLSLSLTGCSGGGGGGGGGSPAHAAQTLSTSTTLVVTSVNIGTYTASGITGVQSVTCPVNSSPISAGCTCHIPTAGDIFSESIAGNGAVCGCDLGSGGINNDPVDAYVTCAQQIMGTAIASASLVGIAIQPVAPTEVPASQIETWAAELKAKEDELIRLRNAR